MRLLVLTMILVLGLVLGGTAPFASAQGVQDKVKAANERAAHDYLKHGLMLAAEGSDEAAAKSFHKAISLKPDWAEAYSLLGSALERAGNYKEAEKALRKAVALKPNYGEGWYYLGQFLKAHGQEAEAQAAFKKAQQSAR